MTTMRPSAGLTANCTLEPPVSTPISRSTAIEASRMIWYSLSVSVSAGATVIESPVWTPIGSTFSIEQMMMQLSAVADDLHLVFLPAEHDSSISTSVVGRGVEAALDDLEIPRLVVGDAAAGAAQVKDGRMIAGRPITASAAPVERLSMVWASRERGDFEADLVMASRNSSRSSALSMASALAPIISTPYFSSVPS
jgi:hypothetical protein